ncbi:MAG TPA: PEGA domain-containing protein [Polyangiaceae bacterium]|nr:PEGA domain-containing protein [Polyangiaceae bacterium]
MTRIHHRSLLVPPAARRVIATVTLLCVSAQAFAQTTAASPEKPVPSDKAATPSAPPTANLPLSESLKGMARAEYEAGKLLYADGDFAGAALKFERAYEEGKDARLLWNIAAAEKNRRKYVRVYNLIERYLAEANAALSDADREEARNLLDTVKGFIGELTLEVSPEGAVVDVDDQAAGIAPFTKPLRVEMGERRFRIHKPGFTDVVRTETVPGGGAMTLQVQLVPEVHEGKLRILAGAGDEIRVDDRLLGVSHWEGPMPSGIHRVQVSARGKRPYTSDVGVTDNQTASLRVTLESSAPVSPIREGGGMKAWPWIAGGVAAVGLGVGAYFLFRPRETQQTPPIDGTLDPGSIPLALRFQ